jgi:predicted metal-binding membrane protein
MATMESATPRRTPAQPGLVQLGLVGLLLGLAAIAWVVTGDRMAGMDAGPGTDPGTLGFYVTAWVVMMAAMMFPSIWPMVTMYSRIQEGKRARGRDVPLGATAAFVGGYLLTWTAWGLFAYAVYEIGSSIWPDALGWERGGPYFAGGVIIAAALYQLTPLKNACLKRCRSPMMFLMNAWQPGRIGALRMGLAHGAWCVGCCWGLMASLFALGVMSVGWMVFIAALIAAEKLLPWRALASYGIAVLLLAMGLLVAFTPSSVPGLILPDSPEATRAHEMHRGSMGDGAQHHGEHSKPSGSMHDEGMPAGDMPGH